MGITYTPSDTNTYTHLHLYLFLYHIDNFVKHWVYTEAFDSDQHHRVSFYTANSILWQWKTCSIYSSYVYWLIKMYVCNSLPSLIQPISSRRCCPHFIQVLSPRATLLPWLLLLHGCCHGSLSHTGTLFTPFGPSCPPLGHSPSRSLPHLPHPSLPPGSDTLTWITPTPRPPPHPTEVPVPLSRPLFLYLHPPHSAWPLTSCARYRPLWVLSYPSKLSYLAVDYVSVETQFSTSCPKLLSMDVFSPCLSADIPSWPAFLCGHSSHPDILALGSRGSPVLRWTPTTLGHTCLSGTNVSRKGSKEKRKTAVGLLVSRNLWHFVFDYPCVLISLALLLFCGGIYGLCYASCSVVSNSLPSFEL